MKKFNKKEIKEKIKKTAKAAAMVVAGAAIGIGGMLRILENLTNEKDN